MAIDDDLSVSLPKPPPPHPARREEAIEAALRRFDGTAEAAADAHRPRSTASTWWTRLRQPQIGVLVSAMVVAAIGLPAALIAVRDLSPSPNQETIAPRPTQRGPVASPPAPPMSGPNDRGAFDVRTPPTELANPSPATPGGSAGGGSPAARPSNDDAGVEEASSLAGSPQGPPPPPPAPPPAPRVEPMERSANDAAASELVVTGTRVPQPSVSPDRSSQASKRARTGAAAPAAGAQAVDPSYVAFLTRLQSAIRANDHPSVIRLIDFPLRVYSSGSTRLYPDGPSVEREFDRIFTPRVRQAIMRQQANQLFVRDQGVMIGDGQIWFDHSCPNSACNPLGPVRIKAVNR